MLLTAWWEHVIWLENTALTSFRVDRPPVNHGRRPILSVDRDTVPGMAVTTNRPPAAAPNDLGRYFLERANAGDVEGLVALYEPNAVLAFPAGNIATGHAEIREVYAQFVAAAPVLAPGRQRPPLVSGDLALTSTELTTGAVTVEIAHRQPDGSWLWAVDQPAFVP